MKKFIYTLVFVVATFTLETVKDATNVKEQIVVTDNALRQKLTGMTVLQSIETREEVLISDKQEIEGSTNKRQQEGGSMVIIILVMTVLFVAIGTIIFYYIKGRKFQENQTSLQKNPHDGEIITT